MAFELRLGEPEIEERRLLRRSPKDAGEPAAAMTCVYILESLIEPGRFYVGVTRLAGSCASGVLSNPAGAGRR